MDTAETVGWYDKIIVESNVESRAKFAIRHRLPNLAFGCCQVECSAGIIVPAVHIHGVFRELLQP